MAALMSVSTGQRRPAYHLLGLLIAGLVAACTPTALPGSTPTGQTPTGQTPTIQPTAAASSPNVTPALTPASTPTGEASLPDPCVLVAKDEASTAVGSAMADGSSDLFQRPDGTMGRTCYYSAVSGRGILNFDIWRATDEQAAMYKQEQMMFGDVDDVAGVGASAYRVGYTVLVVRQSDYLLEYGIEMVNYDPDTAQQNLRTLAEVSIDRL